MAFMAEPLAANLSDQDNEAHPTTNAAPSDSVPLRRLMFQDSRRHSTSMPSGVVYPIAEATGDQTNRPFAPGRRRSVSTRGIAGTPVTTPPTWATVSSKLHRSVSDIRGRVEITNHPAVNPPKESPYEEMMERFQIRRTPSKKTMGVEGLVTEFSGPPSTARSHNQDHSLRQHPSTHNLSDHFSSVPDLGPRSESFLNFGDGSSFPGAHPPLESELSTGQLGEQINLSHGNLHHHNAHPTSQEHGWALSLLRTIQLWKHRLARPISPYSKISQARYAIIMVATIIYVLWFPVGLAFPKQNPHPHIDTVVGILIGFDILLALRTSYVTETGTVVVSSWQIVWHYLKTRLVLDIFISISLLAHVDTNSFGNKWLSFVVDALTFERLTYIMRFVRMIWIIRTNQAGSGNNFWAWILYSRYSNLFRIAGIVVMVICISHYIACIWTILLGTDDLDDADVTWHEKYSSSFYAALLLMQGEGVPAETVAQNLFASLSVVLGSIVLAVVFGHVAVLVSDFNANATGYQHKMEEVFAMTAKLQLPLPLRDRIHEYYEHLWHEYECLDGEIVQFSKSLSHSLGLEVVLFKYMEVVMHVPFWKDCTPDFQKQLMLHLDVRVYLPNDFIMRQGEVDVEFYMVNRGYCELDRDLNRFERVTTTTVATGRNGFNIGRSNSGIIGRRRTVVMTAHQMDDGNRQSAYELDANQRKYYRNGGRGGKGNEVLISRGQAFGDMALLMNYQRASNVRAVTHVEMCVLSREKFQTVLAKYPEDRRQVVVDMLTLYMQSYEVSRERCPLLELVRKVYSPEKIAKACAKAGAPPPLVPPTLTVRQAAERIYTAINMEPTDATLKFGVGVNIRDKLIDLRERRHKKRSLKSPSKTTPAAASSIDNSNCGCHTNHGNATGGGSGMNKTTETPMDQAPTQTTPRPSLHDRLRQLEEREVLILQGLKDLQSSFQVLRSHQPTSRKRAAPGDDSATTKPNRKPLLRRVGSYVGVASAISLNNKTQGQTSKESPTRYADKLFNQQASRQQSNTECYYREGPRSSQRLVHQPSRTADSLRFTSDIEPPNYTSPNDQPLPEAVATSSITGMNKASDQQFQSTQPSNEVTPVELYPRLRFQRMASRSLRKLEGAVQSRIDSSPAMKTASIDRRKTFQRMHSQSLRTLADALSGPNRPRSSFPRTQTRVLNRMSSFVSDSSGQLNGKRSPTCYADDLYRRRSIEGSKEEGWEK